MERDRQTETEPPSPWFKTQSFEKAQQTQPFQSWQVSQGDEDKVHTPPCDQIRESIAANFESELTSRYWYLSQLQHFPFSEALILVSPIFWYGFPAALEKLAKRADFLSTQKPQWAPHSWMIKNSKALLMNTSPDPTYHHVPARCWPFWPNQMRKAKEIYSALLVANQTPSFAFCQRSGEALLRTRASRRVCPVWRLLGGQAGGGDLEGGILHNWLGEHVWLSLISHSSCLSLGLKNPSHLKERII